MDEEEELEDTLVEEEIISPLPSPNTKYHHKMQHHRKL